MSTIVRGDGKLPSAVMVVGERPGHDEAIEGIPFVGVAGQELFYRLFRICNLSRDDVYTTNLVKTASPLPPSRAEIQRDAPLLLAELTRCKPSIIVTVGYHAARHFLPQFSSTVGDYFAGLPFAVSYGKVTRRSAIVVPIVHSAAALRVPERYQNQLSRDLRMVREVLAQRVHPHAVDRIAPYQVGLASLAPHVPLGLDTEYDSTTGSLQCVTLSTSGNEAAIVELIDNNGIVTPYLKEAISSATRVISHSAKAEYHSLRTVGIDLTKAHVDDTMLKAYLLNLPQSLKVLAFRELGWQLDEYDDLVLPLDESRVRLTLEVAHDRFVHIHRQHQALLKRAAARHRDNGERAASSKALARARYGKAPTEKGQEITARVLTSLKRIVETGDGSVQGDDRERGTRGEESAAARNSKGRTSHGKSGTSRTNEDDATNEAIEASEEESPRDSLRKRWSKSVFAPLVPLPPAASWRDLPQESRRAYALTDAIAHRTLDRHLSRMMVEQNLSRAYSIDRAVLPFLVRNEQIGLAVDVDRLKSLSKQFKRELAEIHDEIDALAGKELNPHSSPQVSDVLFYELGITPTKQTPSHKHYATSDKYLKARKSQHEIIPLILSARQLKKYCSTYTDKLPSLLRNGRYHPDWKYTRTATGRLAEAVILLIPKHDPLAKEEQRVNRALAIRDCFHATDGHALVSVDLSQIELRCMAHLSQDRKLLRAYERDEDIHANVAHELLGAPKRRADQDESKHRLPAKTLNFGVINGMTEYGMLDQLHENGQLQWTIDDVRELLSGWWKIHKGVSHYWQVQIAHAKRTGYVKDLFGARRWIEAVHSTNDEIRSTAERQCLCPIQMTADRISKVWNAKIWKQIIRARQREGQYCEPWIRVHDDTTIESDKHHAKAVAKEMLALVPQLLCIPTTAEAKQGVRWGSLH